MNIIDEEILEIMQESQGLKREMILEMINQNKHNSTTATYYLFLCKKKRKTRLGVNKLVHSFYSGTNFRNS
jgi:hypothetical protein